MMPDGTPIVLGVILTNSLPGPQGPGPYRRRRISHPTLAMMAGIVFTAFLS